MNAYKLAAPLLRWLSAESAHGLTVWGLKNGLVPAQPDFSHPSLEVKLWGLIFPNPIGLAAGFDKNAEVPDAMLTQGFGFVEAGTVTPRPQPGNPKPRLFRLVQDRAVINRMGFNNLGLDVFAANLSACRHQGIIGANIGKNKDTADAALDYETGAKRLAALADYVVINVSSPNTPGLRALQGRKHLADLVTRTRYAMEDGLTGHKDRKPPLLLKIAPDLADEDLKDIANTALFGGLNGLIVSNTTIARPETLTSRHAKQSGGLSGQPLFDASTSTLRRMYSLTFGRVPIIGVGGVSSGLDAYLKIRAGASLVQLYSALVYQGPGLVTEIKQELVKLLARDGFNSVSQAVGADHKQ